MLFCFERDKVFECAATHFRVYHNIGAKFRVFAFTVCFYLIAFTRALGPIDATCLWHKRIRCSPQWRGFNFVLPLDTWSGRGHSAGEFCPFQRLLCSPPSFFLPQQKRSPSSPHLKRQLSSTPKKKKKKDSPGLFTGCAHKLRRVIFSKSCNQNSLLPALKESSAGSFLSAHLVKDNNMSQHSSFHPPPPPSPRVRNAVNSLYTHFFVFGAVCLFHVTVEFPTS